jgi:hypothetical protein
MAILIISLFVLFDEHFNNVCLYGNYESLKRVTHDFRRVANRVNSASTYGQFQLSKRLKKYFSHAKISYCPDF